MWVSRAGVRYPIYKEEMKRVWAVWVFYDLCSKSWAQIQFLQSPRWPEAALPSVMCVKMERALECFVLLGLGSSWCSTGCASWRDGARPLALQLICSPSPQFNSRELKLGHHCPWPHLFYHGDPWKPGSAISYCFRYSFYNCCMFLSHLQTSKWLKIFDASHTG